MNKFIFSIEKNLEAIFYIWLVLLPFPTIKILSVGILNSGKWQYGTMGLYLTEVLFLVICILQLIAWNKNGSIKISNLPTVRQAFFRVDRKKLILIFSVWFLAIWSGLSVIWSLDKTVALYYWLMLLVGLALFFIVLNLKINFQRVGLVFVASGLIQSILAIGQFFSQSVTANKWLGLAMHNPFDVGASVVESHGFWLRAYGGFQSPNILGGFLAVCLIMSVFLYTKASGWQKSFFFFSLIIISAGLFFTFSRSAIISAFVGLIIFYFFAFKQKTSWRIFAPVLALIILSLVLVSFYSSLIFARVTTQTNLEKLSVAQRLTAVNQSQDIIYSHVLSGVGLGNYTYYLYEQNPNLAVNSYQPVHNLFLMIWSELGIVGLASFLFFYFFDSA